MVHQKQSGMVHMLKIHAGLFRGCRDCDHSSAESGTRKCSRNTSKSLPAALEAGRQRAMFFYSSASLAARQEGASLPKSERVRERERESRLSTPPRTCPGLL